MKVKKCWSFHYRFLYRGDLCVKIPYSIMHSNLMSLGLSLVWSGHTSILKSLDNFGGDLRCKFLGPSSSQFRKPSREDPGKSLTSSSLDLFWRKKKNTSENKSLKALKHVHGMKLQTNRNLNLDAFFMYPASCQAISLFIPSV